MRIAIAAWHLRDLNVGLGRYSRALIQALGRVDKENEYEVLLSTPSSFPEQENFHYRTIRFPIFKRRFWEQIAPFLAGNYDILHFPYDTGIVWKGGKVVATVHDLKPLIFPELRPRHNLNDYIQRMAVGNTYGKVDYFVTCSHNSKQDMIEHLGIPSERISVVYPGVSEELFYPSRQPDTEKEHRRPFILSVAGNDPTKNLITLLQAYAQLPPSLRKGCDLVLAGDLHRRSDLLEWVEGHELQQQIRFTGIVSDDELVKLYQRAAMFVFPSRYEGFGLPVLEAMACGCPVICSNVSSLPEVAGDAAILVDPCDSTEFAQAIEALLTGSICIHDLQQKGFARAACFSWDRTAQGIIAVYKEVASGKVVSV